MSTLKAPFNFVPLSEKVYFPEWADRISQDIPFSDGLDGTIELELEAETPIFVRNGSVQKKDKEGNKIVDPTFSHTPDGRFFIPGSSIKGTLRSVMEIITSSKVNIFDETSFSIRDLTKGDDGVFYRAKIKPEKIHCGWLYEENEKPYLDDHGIPWRISPEEIDRVFRIGLDSFVKSGNFKQDANRTAQAKYKLVKDKLFLEGRFVPDEKLKAALSVGGREFVCLSEESSAENGTIVFTGQSSQRKKTVKKDTGKERWTGKYFEFVFPDKCIVEGIPVDKQIYIDFRSIHQGSDDYNNLWKSKLADGSPIPVFFTLDSDSSVEAIGLSYMFKYPTFKILSDSLREDDSSLDLDMTECIFGRISDGQSHCGRVMFGHAFAEGNPVAMDEIKLVLSSPHPSYYPLYLGNGQTWNSENVRIAGRKRYPTRNSLSESTVGTDKMGSPCKPLPKGTKFKEVIRFHNLRRLELGALISTITFAGGTGCCHSIGSGKPYGYGKTKVSKLEVNIIDSEVTGEQCFNEFEKLIAGYRGPAVLAELQAMARGIPAGREEEFTYMRMDKDGGNNEFVEGKKAYKKAGAQLGLFSQILDRTVPQSAYQGNVSENVARKSTKAILEEKQIRTAQYTQLLEEAQDCINAGNYEEAQVKLSQAEPLFVSKNDIQKLYDEIEKKKSETQTVIILEAQKCVTAGNELFNAGEYEKALESYSKAEGYVDVVDKINKCKKMINISKGDIPIKMSSFAVFAKYLKDLAPIDDKIPQIVDKMKEQYGQMNSSKKKEWKEFKKWKQVVEVLGEDKARELYDKLIS